MRSNGQNNFLLNGVAAGGLFTGADGVKTPYQAKVFGGTAGYKTPCGTKPEVMARPGSVNAVRPPSPAGSADGDGAGDEDEARPRRRDETIGDRTRIPPAQP